MHPGLPALRDASKLSRSRCVPGREVSCSLLARLTPELSYAAEVLASLLILGLGFG